MSKRKMIEGLLETFDYAIASGSSEECARQFIIWQSRVGSALKSAGMTEEHQAWVDAAELTHFYDDDATFVTQAETMKAILIGILEKVEIDEPVTELFPFEIIEETRNYIQQLAIQANGCYQKGWYDACAVMVRRLVEILIIDCFERHGIASKIEDADSNYYGLGQLIDLFLAENAWHIPRLVRKYLPKLKELKEIGDTAAHGRHLITARQIEDLSKAFTNIFQALIEIAYP